MVSGKVKALEPIHDSRKSFYGKAEVVVDDLGDTVRSYDLYSYGTVVANITYDYAHKDVKVYDTHSATTLRHIKEFLIQHGCKAESKAQIEKDYIRGVNV